MTPENSGSNGPPEQAEPALDGERSRACINCGQIGVVQFCSHCGQRVHRQRFVLGALVRAGAEEALKLDKGLLHTAVALSLRPGHAIREYTKGRTRPYTNPIKYLLIFVALAVLGHGWFGFQEAWLSPDPEMDPAVERVLYLYVRYFNVFLLLVVPFFALYSRLLFRRSGDNLTEHFIFNIYVCGHQNLLSLIILPLVFLPDYSTESYITIYFVLINLYYIIACRQFFRVGMGSAILRAVLVSIFANVTYILAVVLTLRGYLHFLRAG